MKNEVWNLLDGKQAFLDVKNIHFLKSKNWSFFQGVNPQFWSKVINFFYTCFYANRVKNKV